MGSGVNFLKSGAPSQGASASPAVRWGDGATPNTKPLSKGAAWTIQKGSRTRKLWKGFIKISTLWLLNVSDLPWGIFVMHMQAARCIMHFLSLLSYTQHCTGELWVHGSALRSDRKSRLWPSLRKQNLTSGRHAERDGGAPSCFCLIEAEYMEAHC